MSLDRVVLFALTDLARFGEPRTLDCFERLAFAAAPGTVAIDVREPSLPVAELVRLCRRLRATARRHGQALVVHARPDLAVLLEADALHLGEAGLASADARHLVGALPLLRACHSVESAAEVDATHVLLSPILEPRKANPALGLAALRAARARLDQGPRPRKLLALGGVDASNAARCLVAGADAVAAIGGVFGADDPSALLGALGILRQADVAAAPFIHPAADVEPDVELGDGAQVWRHCHVLRGARLGARVMLGQGCFVAGSVRVGADCRVQNHVSLYDGVELDSGVFVGPSAVFTNVARPRAGHSRQGVYQATRVAGGATIGANATVVCGVRIGSYAFVAAGAVVTRDVADYSLVMGVPARHAGWVSRRGEPLSFEAGGARCPASGEMYRLVAGRVVWDGAAPPSD